VIDKPAGMNTHAPSPYAGEGIYDWLRNREPRWAELAIIHRLDKETSGVLVFSKTRLANRSLTDQFTNREVRKKYLLLTDRAVPSKEILVRTALKRVGEKYVSRPLHAGGQIAETRFRRVPSVECRVSSAISVRLQLVEVEPLTGRTHQIRVHAAESGFPVFGDTLYGGTAAERMYLHAMELRLSHPETGKEMSFHAPPDFGRDPAQALRAAIVEPGETGAFRVVHGASDGWPGLYVERLGEFLLCQSEQALKRPELDMVKRLRNDLGARGAYHKMRTRQERATGETQLLIGEAATERFNILENGMQFEMSFGEGYSTGLFLDQRDNRRRLLTGYIAPGFSLRSNGQHQTHGVLAELSVLNTFAYTCGFSVCAAKSGFCTTSIDLSKKYLEWGKRNFLLNQIDPADHEFLYGDVFAWLRRLARKQRLFDVILLDPPTFSASKESGAFQARKDYGRLMVAALPLLGPGGIVFASTNAADWPAEKFLECLESAVRSGKRKILQCHYAPQPPDFPVSRAEPAYLKTVWLKIG